MDSKLLPMSFIKRVHKVMKSMFYVPVKIKCDYDTRYGSYVTPEKTALVLDILNGGDVLAMEGVTSALLKARILHEVKGTQIVVDFKRNGA